MKPQGWWLGGAGLVINRDAVNDTDCDDPRRLARRLYTSYIADVHSPESIMPGTRPRVRKNLRLNQAKLDRARRILGTTTETETVEQALDLVAFRQEVVAGVRRLAGSKTLRDPFARG